jgi:uncharacterized protein
MSVEVADNPADKRFEITVDGERVGFADYRLNADVITITHTEIAPEHEGQGLAGQLVAYALDASRDAGLKVRPLCPYVAKYISRNPEYADLLAE